MTFILLVSALDVQISCFKKELSCASLLKMYWLLFCQSLVTLKNGTAF